MEEQRHKELIVGLTSLISVIQQLVEEQHTYPHNGSISEA